MKKFLSVLFGLMFLQSVYCNEFSDNPEIGFVQGSLLHDFASDKLDEAAIRALCKKLLSFASMHNVTIVLETTDNRLFSPVSSSCEKHSIDSVRNIVMGAAVQLSKETFEKRSTCVQDLMKHNAFLRCEGSQSSQAKYLRYQGYTIDFNKSNTVIDCSETDNRCVVNRPISKGGTSSYLSVCCSVPVYSCDESKSGSSSFTNTQLGHVDVHAIEYVSSARTLNDFDHECKPVK